MAKEKDEKIKKLLLGLLFDAIGLLSFTIPLVGEFSDIVWAPLSAWLMTKMYRGKIGQAAGVITFVEEIIPGLDVIPTFTIMWLYTYVFKGSRKKEILEAK
ncbi:hypothetical protein ACEZ3G_09600 [Maribacter algicola]|uniref:Uncharacterized protein n=1 Tax=Meishania litoralis TaxID=3434685 RepID=A0ACC7LKD0_9FLAO